MCYYVSNGYIPLSRSRLQSIWNRIQSGFNLMKKISNKLDLRFSSLVRFTVAFD